MPGAAAGRSVERGLLKLCFMRPQNQMRPEDQLEATRRRLESGVLAGFVATIVMTALALAAPVLAGPDGARAAGRALEVLRGHAWLACVAIGAHLTYGSLAGGLFAVASRRPTVASGLLFGAALWGIAAAVYAPLVGLGFLAAKAPALAVLAIPLHLAYGVALGALIPRGEIVQPLESAEPDLR